MFTDAEVAYLDGQPLGRLATVGPNGRPQVKPVGFFLEPGTQAIVIGGLDMAASRKFRDAERRPDVALVIDDLAAVDPWTPRGIEIRGHAETHTDGGKEVGESLDAGFPFDHAYIRVLPRRILSWGIDNGSFELSARDVTQPQH